MAATDIGPIDRSERIGALDVLRGVAVCGILLMNIPVMGLALEGPAYPARVNADWIAFSIQSLAFEGSMRGLFTLLFGAGMLIMLRHAGAQAADRAAQAYFTRCFALMLLGVANVVLFFWPGEILFNYGVAGLALFLFRKADLRLLWTAAATLLVVTSILFGAPAMNGSDMLRQGEAAAAAQSAGRTLTDEQTAALEKRREAMAEVHPGAAEIAAMRAERTSLPSLAAWSVGEWMHYNFSKSALGSMFETVGVMLIGMALFRTGVLTGERSLRFYALLAVGGYGLGIIVRGTLLALQWRVGFEPSPGLVPLLGFTYELGRLPVTFGALGLVMLLFQVGAPGWIAGALQAIGRLALTNYIGQSIITSVIFYGLGLFDRLGFAALMGVAALIWVAQGLFSVIWLRVFDMGPAEALLRSLTYGAWRPLSRARSAR